MDVFVVLEGTSVLGAAATAEDAERIADRGSPGRWTDWRDGPNHTDRRRDRDDRMLTQRIVRTPLADEYWDATEAAQNDGYRRRVSRVPLFDEEIREIGRSFGAP